MAHKLLCFFVLALVLPALGCTTTTAKPALASQQSFMDKMTANVKSGTSKMVAAVTPKKQPPGTPYSAPSGKPGPNVFVAAAQMHETSNNYAEAEANYRKALELDPNHLDALIGFARLEDRHGNFEAATRYYQRAIRKHPKDASVHNDLGLCYHRRGMLSEATKELKRAVDLDGESKLYRNNLAAAYVEQGKNNEALAQLSAVHGKSIGHYNLGFLLMQKQDTRNALYHFQKSAEIDPRNSAAQQWIARLSPPSGPYAVPAGGQAVVAQQQYPAAYQAPRNASATYVAQHGGPGAGSRATIRAATAIRAAARHPGVRTGGASTLGRSDAAAARPVVLCGRCRPAQLRANASAGGPPPTTSGRSCACRTDRRRAPGLRPSPPWPTPLDRPPRHCWRRPRGCGWLLCRAII